MSKSPINDLILALANSTIALERAGCQFWACKGTEQPPEHMVTCFCCKQIVDNRSLLSKIEISTILKE